MTHFKS